MATIALVEPEPPGCHVFSGFRMPRMGLPSIGAVLKQQGHRVSIYCQSIRAARTEELLTADIIGLSTTTSTAPEAYRLADLCRATGKPVILGGVHATFCADEALQHADHVVRGEAEPVIAPLVERIGARAPVDDLPGVFTEPGHAPAGVQRPVHGPDAASRDAHFWGVERGRPGLRARLAPLRGPACGLRPAPYDGRGLAARGLAGAGEVLLGVGVPEVLRRTSAGGWGHQDVRAKADQTVRRRHSPVRRAAGLSRGRPARRAAVDTTAGDSRRERRHCRLRRRQPWTS